MARRGKSFRQKAQPVQSQGEVTAAIQHLRETSNTPHRNHVRSLRPSDQLSNPTPRHSDATPLSHEASSSSSGVTATAIGSSDAISRVSTGRADSSLDSTTSIHWIPGETHCHHETEDPREHVSDFPPHVSDFLRASSDCASPRNSLALRHYSSSAHLNGLTRRLN